MKKFYLALFSAGLLFAGIAHAQVASPNYFRSVGGNVYPIQASTTIGTSTVNGAFNNISISGTCSGSGCGAGGSSTAAGSSGQVQFNGGGGSFAASSSLSYNSSKITLTLSNGQIPTSISASGSSSIINYFNSNYYFPVPSQLALNGCAGATSITDAGACVNYIASIAPSTGENIYIPPWQYAYKTGITINPKLINVIGSGGGGFYAPGATTLIYTGIGPWAYNYDVAAYSSAGVGLYDLDLVGPAGLYAGGLTGIGSSTAPAATASYGSIVSASSTSNLVTYSLNTDTPDYPRNAEQVIFTGSSLPGGLASGTVYYVGNENTGANTFEVFTTSALSTPVTLTGTGTGTFNAGIVYGVWVGGPNGATTWQMQGVNVQGFPIAVGIGDNAFRVSIDHDSIQKNGVDVQSLALGSLYDTGNNAVGENNSITNSVIADCNSNQGSISDDCIYIQQSGNIQWTIQGNSIDDAQSFSSQYGGTANITRYLANHLESPNTGQNPYYFIAGNSNQNAVGGMLIQSIGNDYMSDFTSNPPTCDVLNGASFYSSNDTSELNNNVSAPLNAFVCNQDGNDVVSWSNLATKGGNPGTGNGIVNVVASSTSPYSINGLIYGTTTPAFYNNTSTFSIGTNLNLPSLSAGKFLALNASGNVVTTSTPSGSGGVSTSTANTWTAQQTYTGGLVASGSQYYAAFASSTAVASATTVNWNVSNVQELKLTTSTTLSFMNTNPGARYILTLLQDGTGSRLVTWPSTVQWAGGTAPTLTATANKLDIVTFVCAGVSSTDCYGGANLNYQP